MPALSNPRHEHFARCIAEGLSATQAYVKAGYSEQGAAVSANRLLRNANVVSRCRELSQAVTEQVVAQASVDKAWVLHELVSIAKAQKSKQPMAANRALELVGKELGMFVDRKQINLRRISDLGTDDISALLADAENEIRRMESTGDTVQ
jgi:Terminase small subunit